MNHLNIVYWFTVLLSFFHSKTNQYLDHVFEVVSPRLIVTRAYDFASRVHSVVFIH